MIFFYRLTSSLFFIAYLLFAPDAHVLAAPKYPITNFTPNDYNGGIQNIDFAQNRDMNLFMANNLGILSYNGDNWKIYARDTGKKQRSLEFDPINNRLYVGSQGEFGYFEDDWDYVSLSSQLTDSAPTFDEVWDVIMHDSKVYFCTFQGIFVFDGTTLDIISNEIGFDRSFDTGQEMFTQNSLGKLFKVEGNSLIPYLAQNQDNSIVAGVLSTSEGYYVFYNSGEIEYSTLNRVEPAFEMLSRRLKGKYVNHILRLSDNRIVISTQREGLFIYDMEDDSIDNINSADGLQSNACLRTFQDNSGNLWVGMQSGLALIDINSPLRLINRESNLQGSGYEAYETPSGNYYTTSNGIFYLGNNQSSAKFLEGTAGPAYGMRVIEGILYAGHHTGLFQLSDGKAKRISRSNGLWEVKQLKANPDYAIGGSYEGMHLFRLNANNELEDLGKINGFNESSRFFEEDREGKIWVSQFYKGIYKLELSDDLKRVDVSRISDMYSSIPIQEHAFLSRIDNEIYFGTEEGVYRLDQVTNEIVKEERFNEIIGDSWVYLFVQDKENNVHVYTEDVVGYFKQIGPNNYGFVPSSVFQLRQSFNNDLIKISINVAKGIYFNANEGFISYNPVLEDLSVSEKKPVITLVRGVANEDSIYYEKKPFGQMPDEIGAISVEEGVRVLQVKVESFKYRNMGKKQFRYLLRGLEDEYGYWTNETLKEYTNLQSGSYELFIQTVNAQGEIITSEPLIINVNPPFYKSKWGRLLGIGTFVFLIILGYIMQRRYYKQKSKRLEKSKQIEINHKQNELQNLKKEQVETELRHVNNLLAASTMNLVVKNEFMENIRNAIKKVSVDKDVKSTKTELTKIVKEIDTTLKVQDDWEQFEFHFDKVHGDFLTRLTSEYTDLTPGEQKLCAFLRLKMDTKEVANLLGISLRGVEVARYRLRKKLGLENYQNLSKFILEY